MSQESRLIVALDIYDSQRALEIARSAEGKVRAIKVNWPLLMTNGVEIIQRLSKFSDILCDLKVADIPNTNRLITQKVRDSGAWGIISHIFPGRDSLEAVIDAAGSMKVVGVAAMSHPGSSEFMVPLKEKFLDIALESGLYGIISPGNNYGLTKELKTRAGNLKIISPGVGTQGGKISQAIRSGSDYIIIGRHIYESDDPGARIDEINIEMKEVA